MEHISKNYKVQSSTYDQFFDTFQNLNNLAKIYLSEVKSLLSGSRNTELNILAFKYILHEADNQELDTPLEKEKRRKLYQTFLLVEHCERRYEALMNQQNPNQNMVDQMLFKRDNAVTTLRDLIVVPYDMLLMNSIKQKLKKNNNNQNINLYNELNTFNKSIVNFLFQQGFRRFDDLRPMINFVSQYTPSIFDSREKTERKEKYYRDFVSQSLETQIRNASHIFSSDDAETVKEYATLLKMSGTICTYLKDIEITSNNHFTGNHALKLSLDENYTNNPKLNKINRERAFASTAYVLNTHEITLLSQITGMTFDKNKIVNG